MELYPIKRNSPGTVLAYFPWEWELPRRASMFTVHILAEIRTECLPSTRQERYRYRYPFSEQSTTPPSEKKSSIERIVPTHKQNKYKADCA
jgi:hypothetical protein